MKKLYCDNSQNYTKANQNIFIINNINW